MNRSEFDADFIVEASPAGRLGLSVVGSLVLLGWDVVEQTVQAAVVVPVDPLHRRVFDVVDRLKRTGEKWAVPADGFGFEQTDRRFGQGVVVGLSG